MTLQQITVKLQRKNRLGGLNFGKHLRKFMLFTTKVIQILFSMLIIDIVSSEMFPLKSISKMENLFQQNI
jgi:hypothetical protein